MAGKSLKVKVVRYDPNGSPEPYEQSYQVEVTHGMMVLDALTHIRDDQDPTLAFRWSCRMGICGSCGMTVDGRPRLTCQDRVENYRNGEITVGPMEHFPVVRDLVVDIGDFMQKLKAVKPWIIREQEKPISEGAYDQTPAQRALYEPHSACINCTLCYAACPVYGENPEFIGPAAIALAHRYNLDSRDEGAKERLDILNSHEGAWSCTFIGECSVVCPKHVLPAESIQRSKLQIAKKWAFSTLLRGKKA